MSRISVLNIDFHRSCSEHRLFNGYFNDIPVCGFDFNKLSDNAAVDKRDKLSEIRCFQAAALPLT